MNITVVGLGLIGGSFCKAIKQNTEHTVFGIDQNNQVTAQARKDGAIDYAGTRDALALSEIVIVALYPKDTVAYIREHAAYMKPGAIVMDCGGVKRYIAHELDAYCKEQPFTFIGAHPMAGKERGGYQNSSGDLFLNASFIMTPGSCDASAVHKLEEFARSIGFSMVVTTTPDRHDEMIAYTSQLPHVLASSYIFDKNAPDHKGYSAGSFRDVSRVATINADLWSELFLENKTYLLEQIKSLISHLEEYADIIKKDDELALREKLSLGSKIMEALSE